MRKSVFVSDVFSSEAVQRSLITPAPEMKECRIYLTRIDQIPPTTKKPNNLLSCKICGKHIRTKYNLLRHIERVHEKVKNYFCSFCSTHFYSHSQLQRHVTMHTKERCIKCKICDFLLSDFTALHKHEKIHFKSKYFKVSVTLAEFKKSKRQIDCKFICTTCNETFESYSKISNHITPFVKCLKCNDCGMGFTLLEAKQRHAEKEEQQLECKFCFKLLTSECQHQKHQNSHIQRGDYSKTKKCPQCPSILQTPGSLKRHFQLNHISECQTKFRTCTKCDMNFDSEMLLKLHKSTAHSVGNATTVECHICKVKLNKRKGIYAEHIFKTHCSKKQQCIYCFRVYSDIRVLKGHITRHIARSKLTKQKQIQAGIVCKICLKTYASITSFRVHSKSHNKKFRLKCFNCGKGFRDKGIFNDHIRRHLKEQPYECEKCGKTWTSLGDLKKHLASHGNVQNYSCQFCNKSFNFLENRRRHEKTVHSENKVSCSVCSKTFKHWNYLKDHLVIHNTENMFKCKFCSKSYKSRSNMYRHIRVFHNKNNN